MFRRILCRGICLPLVFPSETLFRRRQKDRERVREPRTSADMFTFTVLCGHVHFYSLVRTCSLLQSCADMFTFAVLCGHVHFAVMFMYTLRIRRIRFAYATATFLQARNSRRHARTRTLSPRELCTESVHFKSVV